MRTRGDDLGAFMALVKSLWRSTCNAVALYWLRRRFRRRASIAPTQFVAFIDVLGFSNRLSKWDAALDFYLEMISTTRRALDRWHSEWALENGSAHIEPVDMTIISDSIILSSDSLIKIAKASAFLQANALTHGVLVRGSIAFGRHFTFSFSHGHLILSDALAKAVAGEKEAKFPRITIHPELLQNLETSFFQQEGEGLRRALKTDFQLFLQSEDGRWCLNPFLDLRDFPRMKEDLVRLLDQTDEITPSVREKLLWLAHALNYWIVAPREKMWMGRLYDQDPNAFLEALGAAYDILPEVGRDIVPVWRYSKKARSIL
jgi:hypothetical protein